MAGKLKVKSVINRGNRYFLVDARTLGAGRRYFETRSDAQEFADSKDIEAKRFGSAAFALTSKDGLEFIQAKERLDKLGATITAAVDFYERHHSAAVQLPLSKAVEEFIATKKAAKLSDRYIEQIGYSLASLKQSVGEKTVVSAIARADIEKWLHGSGWSPPTIRTKSIDVQSFFSVAVKRGWCSINPCASLEPVKIVSKAPGILTVDQVRAVMGAARRSEPTTVPYFSLGIFCGIRPAEICRLSASMVNIERNYVEVPAMHAKSRQRRLVTISSNCAEWLKLGCELPTGNLARKIKRVIEAAANGKPFWTQDCMRHSFASYHLAQHESAEKTALQMGHGGTDMLFRHYRELVTKDQAAAFWAIKPPAPSVEPQ